MKIKILREEGGKMIGAFLIDDGSVVRTAFVSDIVSGSNGTMEVLENQDAKAFEELMREENLAEKDAGRVHTVGVAFDNE